LEAAAPDGSLAYGGMKKCRTPCISPPHTHDTTGILHTESANPKPNTLGQFFTESGCPSADQGEAPARRCALEHPALFQTGLYEVWLESICLR
jgi:hypothetical protein